MPEINEHEEKGVKRIEVDKETLKLKRDIDSVLRTEAGRGVFRHLFYICGYDKSSIAVDGLGVISSENVAYNEARRKVYIQLRNLASQSLLIPIEFKNLDLEETK